MDLLTVLALWAFGSVPVAFALGWAIRSHPPVAHEGSGLRKHAEPVLTP
jgi:hypothetical protein